MRLVLDTNVIVSGVIWGGVPRQLLNLARDERVTLFTSLTLLRELADVLARDKFAPLLASQEISPAFLMQRYGMLASVVRPASIGRTVPTDADDDVVIATALAAQAEMIVTGDSDLLVLHPFQGIQILNAAEALHFIHTHTEGRPPSN